MGFPGFLHKSPSRPVMRWLKYAALAAAFLLLAGCAQTGQMHDQARYEPLEESALFADGRSARDRVPGTFRYTGGEDPAGPAETGVDEAGQPVEGFPVTVDAELIALGQERYDIFCTACHGPEGAGNGPAILYGVPKPPELLGESSRALTSGEIFDIITNGRGNMFPYGYRVQPEERWAIIAYLRAMQLKNGAVEPSDLTPDEINQVGNQP